MSGQGKPKSTYTKTVTPEKAFRLYCSMGSERSIHELHRRIAGEYGEGEAPTNKTLYRWAEKYKWHEKIHGIEAELWQRLLQATVSDAELISFDPRARLVDIAHRLLNKATEYLGNDNLKMDKPHDVANFVKMAILCIQTSEELAGSKTEREAKAKQLDEEKIEEKATTNSAVLLAQLKKATQNGQANNAH